MDTKKRKRHEGKSKKRIKTNKKCKEEDSAEELIEEVREPIPEEDSGDEQTWEEDLKELLNVGKQKVILTKLRSRINRPRKHKEPKAVNSSRGVVYLSHIPHGFYEEEMKSYFSQFGRVTGVNHVKSKRTGRSRGFAFIEFEHQEVAKIVAETMNNYLMHKKILKAKYVPPEEQKPYFFRLPKIDVPLVEKRRMKLRSKINALMNEKEVAEKRKRLEKQLKKKQRELEKLGVQGYSIQVADDSLVQTENAECEAI